MLASRAETEREKQEEELLWFDAMINEKEGESLCRN